MSLKTLMQYVEQQLLCSSSLHSHF